MANIFYPIDKSNLKDIIPIGQDIIYSTLCKGYAKEPISEKKYKWSTHVLLTNEGAAFSIPLNVNYVKKELKTIPNPQSNHFITWCNITILKYQGLVSIKGGFIVPWLYNKIRLEIEFYLERDNKYESKESFKHRTDEFLDKFILIASKERIELGEELYNLLKSNQSLQKSKDFYKNEEYYRFDYSLHREVTRRIKKELKQEKKNKIKQK